MEEDDPEVPEMVILDAASLTAALSRHLFNATVSIYDRVLLEFDGREYVARLVGMEGEGEDDEEGIGMPDTRRGVIDSNTVLYLTEDATFASQIRLDGKLSRADAPPPKNAVALHTNDEECFPVRSKLLQPCIKLTSAVMAGHGVHKEALPEVTVDVDCLTMDRVLRYLEAMSMYSNYVHIW